MSLLIILFWICLGTIFYCYAGYGLFIWLLKAFGLAKAGKKGQLAGQPGVTLIITAYREDGILEARINNCLAIDYPVRLLFVIDGETNAASLFEKHPGIKVIYNPVRAGKYEAIKLAMKEVQTPFVVFSDANSFLNPDCIQQLLGHYADPRTGAVAGEKKVWDENSSPLDEAEGLYWQYESLMKKLDAALYTVTGAAGELYSIRTNLFRPLEKGIVVDDLLISMQVCLQGYRIAYEPNAVATEKGSANLRQESNRKIRIAAGVYQSLTYLSPAMNLFRYPRLAFQFISRKILKWIVCPPFIVLVFVLNGLIVFNGHPSVVYTAMFYIQVLLYLLALVGWLFVKKGRKLGIFSIPFYFVFMNICMVRGFSRFLGKKQPVAWEKAGR